MTYQNIPNDEWIDLLHTEEDCLPRAAVDEFVRRGETVVPLLSEIVSEQFNWTMDVPKWWAVVHATFILGTIGNGIHNYSAAARVTPGRCLRLRLGH